MREAETSGQSVKAIVRRVKQYVSGPPALGRDERGGRDVGHVAIGRRARGWRWGDELKHSDCVRPKARRKSSPERLP